MATPADSVRPRYSVTENEISDRIIGCAIEVHKTLGGPGLLEAVYEEALAWELSQKGLHVGRQVELPITYKNIVLRAPLRIDLLIANEVIVECKSTDAFHPAHEAQARTYLRLSGLRLALVINFGMIFLKDGIRRVAYRLPNEVRPRP